MPRPITLKDIANAVGVHPATVSKALNGHPKIPAATCRRIRETAEAMGYQRDPLLASLARYRRRDAGTDESRKGSLAFVTSWPTSSDSHYRWGQRFILPAAREAAAERGYRLEFINLAEAGLSGERLDAILHARGVSGVVLAESPHLHELDGVNWDRFCWVGIGFGLLRPQLHLVVTSPYASMWTAMRTLRTQGRRRVGLFLREWQDERVDFQWSAAYSAAVNRLQMKGLAHFGSESSDPTEIKDWLKREQPDAVLHYSDPRSQVLRRLVKQTAPVTTIHNLNLPSSDGGTGIYQNLRHLGRKAVDIIVAKIHRHDRGVEKERIVTHVGGVWVDATGR